MPSAAHDDLPLQEIVPGYASRLADWAGSPSASRRRTRDRTPRAMVEGLPDDRCQAPHWGYLFSGRIVVDYGDRRETIVGGQAYYIEPGTG